MAWNPVIIGLVLASVQAPDLSPVRVYLGPIPSVEGFVSSSARLEDSYRDMKSEIRKRAEFREAIQFVESVAEAQLIIEVTDRRRVDSGLRTSSAVATAPDSAIGTSVPVRTKQLYARLAVPGTDYRLDIDGAAGIRRKTYRNQAQNVLRQVAEWIQANRQRLPR